VRVLTWNLFHGRSKPRSGRDLLPEFTELIAGWEWDVALLQEVPPWWPPALAEASGATCATALTSRNSALPLRRALAVRWPDVLKSQGGGANAILVRGERIAAHGRRRLRWWPERRSMHAVRLEPSGVWVANLHAAKNRQDRPRADAAIAVETLLRWAGDAPRLILGGDLNVRDPHPIAGFAPAGGNWVDHVLVRGLRPAGRARTLERGTLSDHRPVMVELASGP
jgi:endonuclease/exonuclease/phosphatase family metal-dependent hydrolase